MNPKSSKNKYVALLRGINVGGHKKVPMAELQKAMTGLNLEEVITVLNSGNIVFHAETEDPEELELLIAKHLNEIFGFPIPTIVREFEEIQGLLIINPFKDVSLSKDLRFYISFLKEDVETGLHLPWESEDKSFQIIAKIDKNIFSILDLSVSGTPKGMETMEKHFGKDITTRNWNSIIRIKKKIEGSS